MYTSPVSLILGFHGCDRKIGERVLAGAAGHLRKSENDYDWLGHGIYFWENNPERALLYARELAAHPRRGKITVKEPFVVGAVIDPGHCLNLVESSSLRMLAEAYALFREACLSAGKQMPENTVDIQTGELLRRNLDCAVIEMLHASQERQNTFDSVRGVFQEGPDLYPNSGFREKNHIQICVRNTQCIKGYFRLIPEK
jgi:hypothetical protein